MTARDLGQVLFIVGAGASYPAPSSLPDFGGLVADIYKEVDPPMVGPLAAVQTKGGPSWEAVPDLMNHQQRTELKFFAQHEYDVVLGMLERRIDGDPRKASTLRRAAQTVLERTVEPNSLHFALVRLGQRFGQTLLVTTNFDRLLSIAAKREKYSSTSFALGEIPNPSRSAEFAGILHIHGMLPQKSERGSSLILTDQDFGDAYLRRHIIPSFLYDAARIFHLVLVGYSANDSPVRYLLNAIAADERHFNDLKPRYAFVGCDPDDERTPVEWQSRGITPIAYDRANNHKALGDLLSRWSEIIPDKRNTSRVQIYLKSLAKMDPDSPDGVEGRSFLRYYVSRSNPSELAELARLLASKAASPIWLSLLNQAVRDTQRRG
ncbi:SIR2 family protein [Rhizobium halophytocola]|uniref:NAD-dependent SIR2 family protein deacetylase n=1 Tax=Rhizobium halophytocola TaxID=735519 RepID=A0ABS4E490_9HYPH|nr:SIR2 family protein [Rhizobium halophytocola]MBP1852726.1 NAD-dependent SIR2 family protein deacetylase [Rhizobium halophytocola]